MVLFPGKRKNMKLTNFNQPLVAVSYLDEAIAVIHMQDIENKNALTPDFVEALLGAFKQVSESQQIKAVVLSGLEDVFCSGANSETLIELSSGQLKPTDILLPKVLLNIPIPVIAAMTGHAVGGGLALGLCADIVIIAKKSRYGCSFINMGFTPGMSITKLLENVFSPTLAHELQYTGEFKLGEAFIGKSGFNEILSKEEVLPKAIDIAQRIAEKPRATLEILKRYLSMPKRKCFEETITVETMMHQISFAQTEIKELIHDNFIK